MSEFHAPIGVVRSGDRRGATADGQSPAMRLIAGRGEGGIGGRRRECAARPRVPHWTLIGVIGLIVGDRFITSAG